MAISFTPGQTVAAPDWEALFQQHGGSKSTVIRPMTKAEESAALDAGDDPTQNPIYRYYADDGSYVEARKAPNGDYLVVGYQPSEKFQQTQRPAPAGQNPNTPAGRDAQAEQYEKDWNEANGPGKPGTSPTDAGRGSGLRETHLERRTREAKEANDADTKRRQGTADANAAADRNKPGAPTLKPDGKGGTIAVQVMPDGSIRETPLPNIPSDVPTVEVGGVRWERGPDGKYAPARGIPTGGEPSGAPPSDTTYGQTVRSLTSYRDFLNAQVAAGTLTPDQADRLMDTRLRLAQQAHNEQQGLVNTQTTIYGQQTTQQGQQLRDTESRRNAAGQNYQGVLNNFTPILKYLPKGGGEAFGAALMGAIQYGQQQATAWGGMATPTAPVLGPAAAQANQTGLTGGPVAAPALPVPPAAPPTAGTFLAPAPPAMAEAARQQAAAGGGATMLAPVLPAPVAAPAPAGPPPAAAPLLPPIPPPNEGGAYAPQMATPGAGQGVDPDQGPHELAPGEGWQNQTPPAQTAPNVGIPPPGQPWPTAQPDPLDEEIIVRYWSGQEIPVTRREFESWPPFKRMQYTVVGPTVVRETNQAPVNVPASSDAAPQSMVQPSFLSPYQQQPAALSSQYDALIADPWISNDLVEEARRRVYGSPGMVAA